MDPHLSAHDTPPPIATRTMPGGVWASAWPLLVAAFIAALLVRSCVIAPVTALPVGFDADISARTANERALLMLERIGPHSSPAMVLAAVNTVVVNFASGSATVPAAADVPLARAADALAVLPAGLRLEIAGHTDATGSPIGNAKLGRARAAAVRELLVKNGFPPERVVVLSYGDTRPIADNRSEEGRFRNRRIEFSLAL
ncbi:MAG: OmpA family protein [Burkholderiaceae bacterium]